MKIRGQALWDEALIRVSLVVAVECGERGSYERPTEHQVLNLAMILSTRMDWAAYNRAHGGSAFPPSPRRG